MVYTWRLRAHLISEREWIELASSPNMPAPSVAESAPLPPSCPRTTCDESRKLRTTAPPIISRVTCAPGGGRHMRGSRV